MKLDRDAKRQVIKIIMNAVDCNEPFDIYSIMTTLVEDGEWDVRIKPKDGYMQIEKIVKNIIPIIEYKQTETEEGFVYTPYNI